MNMWERSNNLEVPYELRSKGETYAELEETRPSEISITLSWKLLIWLTLFVPFCIWLGANL